MSLNDELTAFYEDFHRTLPKQVSDTIKDSTRDFRESFRSPAAVQVGQRFPEFRLADATGKQVASADLLAQGALLITFYRGEWCPYCNLALKALQRHVRDFKAKGVTLLAISPELPNQALTTQQKNELEFTVLSDVGNQLAKRLGILFPQPDSMRPVFAGYAIDLAVRNGDDSLEVPVPATFLVDRLGTIRNAFVDPDYTKRIEPATALEWIDALG
ncbi:peroxiredoxin-like family protein [Pseudomonas graminis]|uniref:peroxiredoxin-like family protein n=1 Tax=Pseudomonas graminis TaxID=158627 RepID=UPI003C20EC28